MKLKKTKPKSNITSKNNTSEKILAKKETFDEEYYNTLSFRLEPATNGFFTRLAIQLITWARQDENAFMISQFYNNKGILKGTFYRWVDKHPELKQAHEAAISFISDRRELFLIEKDPSSVRYVMPQYSDIWAREEERKAKLKKQEDEQNQNITVVMEPFKKKDE